MTSVYIDPYILSCPHPKEGREKYEHFITTLLDWQELNSCDWVKIFTLSNTVDILYELGKYPLWQDLKNANNTFGIDYVAPDAVMKLVHSFLSKYESIERHISLKEVQYSDFELTPSDCLQREEDILQDSLKDIMVYMVLKCRTLIDIAENQILITAQEKTKTFNVQFKIVSIEFEDGLYTEYAKKKPIDETETFCLFCNYQGLQNAKQITLVESTIPPNAKKIKLSGDHHGNDKLNELAQKLITHRYIDSIVNNLPFNPTSKKTIHKVYPNGQIDIVLISTDAGYSLRAQSTGRNIIETIAISKMLEDEFLAKL